ncbi:MAG: Rieske 2Fe-2S domain-containing protein, partial [Alphaproteobacteria bacterium]|nr:Rieske 2Fe-2S domain-containing protein [Alphaproteobacteria bacterium]
MTLLKKVSQPIETANGLPNPLYTDPAVYAEESRTLLLGNWSGIAFEGDVPEVGDVYPVELAGVPLVVVRGRDQEIRVFENVCRHRGMVLVQEAGK